VTAPALSPEPESPQAEPAVNTKPRSKRLYVLWAIALTLLISLGAFCWLVVVPVWQVRRVVNSRSSPSDPFLVDFSRLPRGDLFDKIKDLGGPRQAVRRLGNYLLLPDAVAPAKRNAAHLLVCCGMPAKGCILKLIESDRPLPIILSLETLARARAWSTESRGESPAIVPRIPLEAVSPLTTDAEILTALAREMYGWPGDRWDEMSERERQRRSLNAFCLGSARMVLLCAGTKARPALPYLIRNIGHSDPAIRHYSMGSLHDIGPLPPSATRPLLRLVDDEATEIYNDRSVVVELLGNIRPPAEEAVPVLLRLSEHEKSMVSQAATEALKKIKAAQEEQKR
jgi:hypothetical protein